MSPYIVVDQFGYRPDAKKVAVIRDPITGFDAAQAFTPGTPYSLINADTDEAVFTDDITAWKGGSTNASSGDRAWWFDFSSVKTTGKYYVLDVTRNVRSYSFEIRDNVYTEVLKHAVRTFFYQRAGFEKKAQYAGAEWADGPSHLGNLQDKNARQYNRTNDASTERDVSGGWYDAGDYNKYTNWTANYVVDFMRAYIENPGAWGDDYNIPESGNGIPDLLDEAKWGIDHLLRMQNTNGSVLSIVGLSHASPPSAATGPSLYGTASTSATLSSAAAFAISSKVFASRGMTVYADKLKDAAIRAWNWANTNPSVIFKNNDAASGTSGLGAGQQETDDYGRFVAKLRAAVFLFDLTGESKYREFVDNNYSKIHLIEWNFAYPFETTNQEALLYYTQVPEATSSIAQNILSVYKNAMNNGDENFPAITSSKDPYRAHLKDYTWGSNSTKASQGLMFSDVITYSVDESKNEIAETAAEGYIHYIHGVNPLNFVYLSNMYAYGAENGVNEFYHTWFGDGSAKWDRVGVSTYGPAPGFLTGGPNPSYDRDGCCATNSCGGSNAVCDLENLSPPMNQPVQKSYKDFNTSWPLNSWSVTENSNGYQLNYIRLLAKFVPNNYDCSGTLNGSASFDACNICSGGTTGIEPKTDPETCSAVTSNQESSEASIHIYPNPTTGMIQIKSDNQLPYNIQVMDTRGRPFTKGVYNGGVMLNLSGEPAGLYVILITQGAQTEIKKIVKVN